MIISASSASTALTCWQKAFNIYHHGIQGTNLVLIDGSAMHAGIAAGMASGDWQKAKMVAASHFDKLTAEEGMSDEFDFLARDNRELVMAMVGAYELGWRDFDAQILQPECSFNVEIPNTGHNCIFKHWMELDHEGHPVERWDEHDCSKDVIEHKPRGMGGPDGSLLQHDRVFSPHDRPDPGCRCWTNHRVVGTTDAIVRWKGHIWLLEHKSSSIKGEQFWKGFQIDAQPTIYIWAAQRALSMPIAGVLVNAIWRPSDAQVSGWNAKRRNGPAREVKDYVEYQREAFLRTPVQLKEQERQLGLLCDEWEGRMQSNFWPMANSKSICTMYNRSCQFMPLCTSSNDKSELEALLEASVQGARNEANQPQPGE